MFHQDAAERRQESFNRAARRGAGNRPRHHVNRAPAGIELLQALTHEVVQLIPGGVVAADQRPHQAAGIEELA